MISSQTRTKSTKERILTRKFSITAETKVFARVCILLAMSTMMATAWSLSARTTRKRRILRPFGAISSREQSFPRQPFALASSMSRPKTIGFPLYYSTASDHSPNQTTVTINKESKQTTKTPTLTTNDDDKDLANLIQNWRSDPKINPILEFPTLVVPSQEMRHWIQDEALQEFVMKPSQHPIVQHVHPRIKLVQDYNSDDDDDADGAKNKKCILLSMEVTQAHVQDIIEQSGHSVEWGPMFTMPISYQQLSFSYILTQLLSKNDEQNDDDNNNNPLLPPPSGYEQIGTVAHFNLKPQHLPYGALIGQVLMTTQKSISTVVNKIGNVKGKYRTYDYQVLATTGINKDHDDKDHQISSADQQHHHSSSLLETTVVEHGISIHLNVAECYWCTRLSGERQELIKDILDSTTGSTTATGTTPLVVADVFCGVGAICLLLVKQMQQQQANSDDDSHDHGNAIKILANDWNPKAIEYMKSSISKNNLNAAQFSLSCQDTYDYLMDLGASNDDDADDSTTTSFPDHVLMNYPLEAPTFLGALRWWSTDQMTRHYKRTNRYPRFHVYTFAKASQKGLDDEEDVAVEIIANELLPSAIVPVGNQGGEEEEENEEEENEESCQYSSREELDEEFDAQVETRLVRDVAPGKVVVCVSFSLTPKLVRYMQGSF